MSVSIVVPVLNEIEVLPSFWERLYIVVEEINRSSNSRTSPSIIEVIFVDGGSTDGTLSFLEGLSSKFKDRIDGCSIKIIRQPTGTRLAYAEFLGMSSASGDLIIKMDCDLQHDPFFIPQMIQHSTENDIVIASRYIRNGGNNWNPVRGIISRFARFETHVFLPETRGIGDPLSGFFLIHRENIIQVTPHRDGYKLLMYILAFKNRSTTVKEIPYLMTGRNKGSSKIIKSITGTILNFNRELIFVKRVSLIKHESQYDMGENQIKKLLIVSRASFKSGKEGGADKYALTLAKEIKRIANGKVDLYFVGRKNEKLQQLGIKLIEVKNKRNIESSNPIKYFFNGLVLNVSSAITGINFLLKNREVTAVNTNSNIATILTRLAVFGIRTKLTYTIHDTLYSSKEKMNWWKMLIRLMNNFILERIAIKVSSNIISVSPVIINQIPIKHKNKVHLIFPQGNAPSEKTNPNFSQELNDKSILFPKKYALVACYLDDRKRVDAILRSWKFVSEEISLIVVGDGPNYEKLRLLSTMLGLSNRVFFTGRIPDNQLFNLIRNSVFGVIASQREGFPTFIIECLKSGIPAIFFIQGEENVYEKMSGDYLEVKKLVDPWQMSNIINQFNARIYNINHELVKEWGLRTFGLKDELIETLFIK